MRSLSKIYLKIFIFFFIVYSIFSSWHGWNEETRLYTGIRIAENNTFSLGPLAKYTGDRIRYNGTIYGDKPIGIPAMISAIDTIYNHIWDGNVENENEILVPHRQFNTTVYTALIGTKKIKTLRVLSDVFISSVFGALTILLIFKASFKLTKNFYVSLITSFIFGLGTFLFPFSSTIYGEIFVTFFIFVVYYLIIFHNNELTGFLTGMLLLFSMLFSFSSLAYMVPIAIIYFARNYREPKKLFMFIIGSIIGYLPSMIYSFVMFNHFFVLYPKDYVDPYISPCAYGKQYYSGCPVASEFDKFYLSIKRDAVQAINTINLLFSPYRGIFFYSPVLLLSLITFASKDMRKKTNVFLLKSLIIIFVLVIWTVSGYSGWYGGASFGSRYILGLIPLLSIPFSKFLEHYYKNKKILFVVFILFIISFLHMLFSFSSWWEGYIILYRGVNAYLTNLKNIHFDKYIVYKYTKFYDKVVILNSTLETSGLRPMMLNPLYEHYFKSFIKFGPRSRVLEDISNGIFPPDIYTLKPENYEYFEYFYKYNKHLPIILILSLFVIIFHEEIMTFSKKSTSNKKLFYLVVLSIALYTIITTAYFSKKEINPRNVYPSANGYWVKDKMEYAVFFNESKPSYYVISFNARSYYDKEKNIWIYSNGKKHEFIIYDTDTTVNIPIKLYPGKNIIEIGSYSKCHYPYEIENIRDYRCLNFLVSNISLFKINISRNHVDIVGYSGIINKGGEKFLMKKSKLFIYSNFTHDEKFSLSFSLTPFSDENVVIKQGNQTLYNMFLHVNKTYEIKIDDVQLPTGINEIDIVSSSCKIINSNDSHCYSLRLSNVTITPEKKSFISLTGQFYTKLPTDDVNWMRNTGNIVIENYGKPELYILRFYAKSYYRDRQLEIYQDNNMIERIDIFREGTVVSVPVYLQSGTNTIVLVSSNCDVPNKLEASPDNRCISVGISNITLVKTSSLSNISYFLNGFYPRAPNENETWIKKEGEIILYLPYDVSDERIFLNLFPYLTERSVEMFLDGKMTNIFNISISGGWVYTKRFNLNRGIHVIKFVSLEKCTRPSDIIYNDDFRCLSISIRGVKFEE